ncbi:MAG: 3-methyl-2-oxobutanoate hydroxymethyltransferase [Fimbriimonadaceae bacterium]|nr:3-methyl-2-oxobutanoate hydroxymethyltransferase [Fimbriimonadaceae bacterium]
MPEKLTAPKIRGMKGVRPIVCITAYDAPSGEIADLAGADLVLVGDSVANTVMGLDTTVPVTVANMIHHAQAVARTCKRPLLVVDMPFGSYQASPTHAVETAIALVKTGAEAVKLEGVYVDAISAIAKAGIPIMGHIGMTPQSVHAFGGFRVQGKGQDGDRLLEQAKDLEKAGVFAVVLELIPAVLSAKITSSIGIPTIGIGAGPDCDGQIQVLHDVIGLSTGSFKHAKRYANVRTQMLKALRKYADEVRSRTFPSAENSF